MRSLSLAIVGAEYPNANKRGPTRRFELALCAPGEPLELRPEPKNRADPRAIAVYSCRDVQLGYLTAERAPWIGGMLKNGREVTAIFQSATSWGGWARVAFDGDQPILTPVAASAAPPDEFVDEDPGFYPDEVWPD